MKLFKWVRDIFAAFAAPTTMITEKEQAPIEKPLRTDLVPGGTLGDPAANQRIEKHHRIICGMGSGGPEDVNTYAMFDALPQAEKDAIEARRKGKRLIGTVENPPAKIDNQDESRRPAPVQYEDTVMDNYERSSEDGRMKLKDWSQ